MIFLIIMLQCKIYFKTSSTKSFCDTVPLHIPKHFRETQLTKINKKRDVPSALFVLESFRKFISCSKIVYEEKT